MTKSNRFNQPSTWNSVIGNPNDLNEERRRRQSWLRRLMLSIYSGASDSMETLSSSFWKLFCVYCIICLNTSIAGVTMYYANFAKPSIFLFSGLFALGMVALLLGMIELRRKITKVMEADQAGALYCSMVDAYSQRRTMILQSDEDLLIRKLALEHSIITANRIAEVMNVSREACRKELNEDLHQCFKELTLNIHAGHLIQEKMRLKAQLIVLSCSVLVVVITHNALRAIGPKELLEIIKWGEVMVGALIFAAVSASCRSALKLSGFLPKPKQPNSSRSHLDRK